MSTTATPSRRFVSEHARAEVVVPSGWHVVDEPLPAYGYPYQVFGISNYPIDVPEVKSELDGSDESYPRVYSLPADAVLLWLYYFEAPDGPDRYGDARLPIDYDAASPFDTPGDPRWPALNRMEIGFRVGSRTFTLWIWEGKQLPGSVRDELGRVIRSLRVR